MRSSLRACVDWVQVTFRAVPSPTENRVGNIDDLIEYMGLKRENFSSSETGLYGYPNQLRFGHISILYGGRDGMGVHVQMTGQGCREYEANGGNWKKFIQMCLAADAKFTRFDLAIDDIAMKGQKPYFTVAMLRRKIKEGCCRSKMSRGKYIESLKLDTGESIGETLYFGREQSDVQIRVYEKDWERTEAGKELVENLIAWNRIEIQCRRERAQAAALYVYGTDDLKGVVSGVLKNYIAFVVKQEDTNKARWPLCKWWEEFLGEVDKLRLTMIAPDMTIDRSRSWIDKQLPNTLAMLFAAYNGDLQWIIELIEKGSDKLTKEQTRLAVEYSDMLIEKQREREREKREMWNTYLFKTGAGREERRDDEWPYGNG